LLPTDSLAIGNLEAYNDASLIPFWTLLSAIICDISVLGYDFNCFSAESIDLPILVIVIE